MYHVQFYVFKVLETIVFTKWVPHIKRCPRFYVDNLLLSIASRTLFSSSNFCILSLSLSVTICSPNPKPVKSLKKEKDHWRENPHEFRIKYPNIKYPNSLTSDWVDNDFKAQWIWKPSLTSINFPTRSDLILLLSLYNSSCSFNSFSCISPIAP